MTAAYLYVPLLLVTWANCTIEATFQTTAASKMVPKFCIH